MSKLRAIFSGMMYRKMAVNSNVSLNVPLAVGRNTTQKFSVPYEQNVLVKSARYCATSLFPQQTSLPDFSSSLSSSSSRFNSLHRYHHTLSANHYSIGFGSFRSQSTLHQPQVLKHTCSFSTTSASDADTSDHASSQTSSPRYAWIDQVRFNLQSHFLPSLTCSLHEHRNAHRIISHLVTACRFDIGIL